MVSGLPLMTKQPRTRLRLIADAMTLLKPGAPFIQFTYAMLPPIPKALSHITAEPSNLIWLNLPPARVWVYRGQ
jgi:phosphatidylethanolamine/phosphatidyl-N-methylethanolamine N-methyltransferase